MPSQRAKERELTPFPDGRGLVTLFDLSCLFLRFGRECFRADDFDADQFAAFLKVKVDRPCQGLCPMNVSAAHQVDVYVH
jgi:hypothetical protein